jgi:NAD(P)H-dependent FMN reductase
MSEKGRLKIVIVLGSVRPGNYTARAAALVADELGKDPDVAVETIDPALLELPPPGVDPKSAVARELQECVETASGVVLATPEYHGSFSSVMKLVIENLGFPSSLRGKPVALLGVAAGSIGAIKSLEQLRGVCAHVGAIALPLPVSVANVQKVFDSDGRCTDPAVEKLVRRVGTGLLDYVRQNVCPRVQLEQLLREGAS